MKIGVDPRIIELVEKFFDEKKNIYDIEHTIIPDDPQALRALLERAEDEMDRCRFHHWRNRNWPP